jgi:hypothetical protein
VNERYEIIKRNFFLMIYQMKSLSHIEFDVEISLTAEKIRDENSPLRHQKLVMHRIKKKIKEAF